MSLAYDIDPSCQLPREFLSFLYGYCFPNLKNGTYVEVGAYDGVLYGHTSALARLGWRGVCVEPHPEHAERCRKNLGQYNVKVVEVAAGAKEGEIDLYVSKDLDGACSSTKFVPATRAHHLDEEHPIKVPMKPLDMILRESNVLPRFEVLTIDVEEAELEVLAGFDLPLWLPKVAIIETHEKSANPAYNWKGKPVTDLFYANGYQKVYADPTNSVFVRK